MRSATQIWNPESEIGGWGVPLWCASAGAMVLLSAGCSAPGEGWRIVEEERAVAHESAGAEQVAAVAPGPRPRQPAGAALAEAGVPGELTLALVLSLAEQNHPRIAMARDWVRAGEGDVTAAGVYPNPTLDFSAEEIPTSGPIGDSKATVGVTQPIIIGGRRDAAIASARAGLASREAQAELTRREVLLETELLFIRGLVIRDDLKLRAELLASADRVREEARIRVEARAAPESEVVRAEVEVERWRAGIGRLERERAALSERLSLAVGAEVDAAQVTGPVGEANGGLTVEEFQAMTQGGRVHPAVAASESEAKAAEERVRQIRAERVPDLEVRVAGGEGAGEVDTIVEAGVAVTLPLWDAGRGKELAARFEASRARMAAREIHRALRAEAARLHGEHSVAQAAAAGLREEIVPRAQRAADLAREAWRGGRGGFLDVIESQRALGEARTELIEREGEAMEARARIMWIVGAPK